MQRRIVMLEAPLRRVALWAAEQLLDGADEWAPVEEDEEEGADDEGR